MVMFEVHTSAANAPTLPWQARAPPALKLGEVDAAECRSIEERDFDTPREAGPASVGERLPISPTQRRTKSRAARALGRNSSFTSRNSLKDSKVRIILKYVGYFPRVKSLASASNCPASERHDVVCRLGTTYTGFWLQVLMVTDMKRSDSLLHPDLFRYHNHFEFLGVVGRTHLSEVY